MLRPPRASPSFGTLLPARPRCRYVRVSATGTSSFGRVVLYRSATAPMFARASITPGPADDSDAERRCIDLRARPPVPPGTELAVNLERATERITVFDIDRAMHESQRRAESGDPGQTSDRNDRDLQIEARATVRVLRARGAIRASRWSRNTGHLRALTISAAVPAIEPRADNSARPSARVAEPH